MARVLAALLIALLSLPALASDEGREPGDMVLLTVGGFVGKPNRGALNPRHDTMLAKLNVDFKHAFEFDRAMLLELPQGEVTAQPIEFDQPATFSGPLLREVLGFVEAARAKTTFVAADGYRGYLMPEDIAGSDWILALSADGEPLGLGRQGPIWLLNTRAEGFTPGDDGRGTHVWAMIYMHIGE